MLDSKNLAPSEEQNRQQFAEALPMEGFRDIFLRADNMGDVAEIASIVTPELAIYQPWLKDSESITKGVRGSCEEMEQGAGLQYRIVRQKEDGVHIIGSVSVYPSEREPRHFLGYWLVESERGQGIATAAARTALEYAKQVFGTTEVGLQILDSNIGSRKLAQGLGAVEIETGLETVDFADEPQPYHIWRLQL